MRYLQIALGVSWYAIAIGGAIVCHSHPRLAEPWFFSLFGILAIMGAIHFLKLSKK